VKQGTYSEGRFDSREVALAIVAVEAGAKAVRLIACLAVAHLVGHPTIALSRKGLPPELKFQFE